MKKVILSNGDLEVTIVKSSVFSAFEKDDSVVYIAEVRSIKEGTIESLTIIPDYLKENYLVNFLLSSLAD